MPAIYGNAAQNNIGNNFGSGIGVPNFGGSQNFGGGGAGGFSMGFGPASMISGGIGSLLSGIFGDSGAPFEAAGKEYQKYTNQARQAQNPFYNAGTAAIPQYQNWLNQMQNPSGFINNLTNQYQESPWAKFQQDQAMRAGTNAASASGLIGSTPYMQFAQQNARDISSQDMNNWLQNVLGVNQQYGAGQNQMIGRGQESANMISQLLNNLGINMGNIAYNQSAAEGNDFMNMLGGGASILGGLLSL